MSPERPSHPHEVVAELRLTQLAQLFESLDPSPFVERDLDRDAADFIERWFADEASGDRPLVLVVHLPDDQIARSAGLEDAVREKAEDRAEEVLQREGEKLLRGLLGGN